MERVLVIGAGHAGGRVAHHLRGYGFAGGIVLVGEEAHPPYERPPLSKSLLAGASAPADTYLKSPADWASDGVTLRLADPVHLVDATAGSARLASGAEIAFDYLIVATGSSNRQLAIAPHLPSLRTIDDSLALRATMDGARSVAIIGGGVIGLEVAATASAAGLSVTVLEAGSRVMGRILSPPASEWLASEHCAAGVRIVTGSTVEAVEERAGRHVLTVDGKEIEADVVVAAIGSMPQVPDIAGAERGASGGLLTDARCRISGLGPACFSIGDAAESWSPLYSRHVRQETWRNAETQAKSVAATICGQDGPAPELPWMWTDQLGRNIQVLGLWEPGLEVIARGRLGERGSSEYWLKNGEVRGAVLYDNGRERRFIETMMRDRARPPAEALADASVRLRDLAIETA